MFNNFELKKDVDIFTVFPNMDIPISGPKIGFVLLFRKFNLSLKTEDFNVISMTFPYFTHLAFSTSFLIFSRPTFWSEICPLREIVLTS